MLMRKVLTCLLPGLLMFGSLPVPALAAGVQLAVAAEEDDEQYQPNDVSDLTAKWNLVEKRFDISMTAPTQGYYYDYGTWDNKYQDLTAIDRIEVYNGTGSSKELVHTFSNPAPGEKLTCEVSGLERGKTYDFNVVVFANGLESDGKTAWSVLAGGLPAKITDYRVETRNGGMPIRVVFTAPTTYKDSEVPLESLTKVELINNGSSWWDTATTIDVIENPEPGKEYTFTVNDETMSGKLVWKLRSYNSDGESEATEFNVFIGEDNPGYVSDLTAVEQPDGTVKVSWNLPATGQNNGYYDPESLTYTVTLKTPGSWGDDSTELTTGLTETSYVYNPGEMTEVARMRFGVTAKNATGSGYESVSPYIMLGPAMELPFIEGFDTAQGYNLTFDHMWSESSTADTSYPPSWTVAQSTYVGSDNVTPESGEGGLVYLNIYSYTPSGRFMLTSSKIDVASADAVELAFSAYSNGSADLAGAEVGSEISFDNGLTFIPVKSAACKDFSGWTRFSGTVDVPAGAQHATVRLFAVSTTGVDTRFVLDQVSLRAAESQAIIYPASVSGFTAELSADKSAINVSMVAPTHSHATLGDVNNQPLKSISRVVLGRAIGYSSEYTTIHEFTNPAPGEQLTFSDTDLEQGGEYRYRALVYVGDRCDYGNYTDNPVTVGQIPADVTELTATTSRGSAPVVLSFRLPSVDYVGEPLDAVKAVVVTRYNTDTFVWDEIATLTEDLTPGETRTYSDANVSSGAIYEYRVAVRGTAGSSYGVSCSVYVGMDEPVEPSDITAALTADGHVRVTWTAPVKGLNGGYIDVDHLTYMVYRGNGYSDYDATLLRSDVAGTEFTDNATFDDEQLVRYFVKAVSNGMAGYSASSNLLLVGQPSTLPYTETFDTQVGDYIQADHGAWTVTSSEDSPLWAFAEMAYFINEGQVVPVDAGAGLAYAYYGHYSTAERDDYLTSGNINVAGVKNVTLSFHVFGVPGYNHTLDVDVAFDGGEFTGVRHFDYVKDFDNMGWLKCTEPVAIPDNAKTMQVRFHAHKGTYSCSVAIDNIRIVDGTSGIASVEQAPGVMVASVGGVITVAGADASTSVVIADMSGNVIHSATGDCAVKAAPGVYVVRVGSTAVKLLCR